MIETVKIESERQDTFEFLKFGQITEPDRLFNDLACEIISKYFEIAIELGLEDKVLRNELHTGQLASLKGSEKALKMLQLWRDSTDKVNFTYSVLAAALEKHGYRRCSHEYCYIRGIFRDIQVHACIYEHAFTHVKDKINEYEDTIEDC